MKKLYLVLSLVGSVLLFHSSCKKNDITDNPADKIPCSQYYVLDILQKPDRPGLTFLDIAGYQQTTEYTCGPAAVLTLMHFYKREGDEMTIAGEMGTSTTTGTTPQQMASWLEQHGFRVEWGENGSLELIRNNLKNKIPTLVEWSDWGGHWVVAVGYDTRNTETPMDDVIIFADPYDRHDDRNDGIDWFNAQRFYYMWYDALLFGTVMKRLYITATPL